MTQRFYMGFETALDSLGAPISGAKLNFYITATSTPLNTYSDEPLAVPNANPVVSDSAGVFAPIFLQAADYKDCNGFLSAKEAQPASRFRAVFS